MNRNVMLLHFLKTYFKFYVILICLFVLTVTTKSHVPAQYVIGLETLTKPRIGCNTATYQPTSPQSELMMTVLILESKQTMRYGAQSSLK